MSMVRSRRPIACNILGTNIYIYRKLLCRLVSPTVSFASRFRRSIYKHKWYSRLFRCLHIVSRFICAACYFIRDHTILTVQHVMSGVPATQRAIYQPKNLKLRSQNKVCETNCWTSAYEFRHDQNRCKSCAIQSSEKRLRYQPC